MVLARNTLAAQRLGDLFRAKTEWALAGLPEAREAMVRKVYWALVACPPMLDGRMVKRGQIRLALAPGRGDRRHAMVAARRGEEGLTALTAFHVLPHEGPPEGGPVWLELEPLTGRKHQLRAHCAIALQCPVVGDAVYGGQNQAAYGSSKLHLHARSLELPHPTQAGVWVQATAPLPPHMRTKWPDG